MIQVLSRQVNLRILKLPDYNPITETDKPFVVKAWIKSFLFVQSSQFCTNLCLSCYASSLLKY